MAKNPTLQLMVGGRIPLEIEPVAEVELLELLGVGGFGWVWKVRDIATLKPYAMKLVAEVKPGSIQAERVRLEAEIAIPSEYVVPVVGLRQWDPSTFFILFEYVPGASLDKLIEAGALTPDQRQDILRQILTGVADAHRHNIIHRDLKPANILVNDEKQVKIIDFGISKFKEKRLTMAGDVMGTIPYMALELFLEGARTADARTDIYSLGHIFYELAMGRHFWTRRGWSFDHFIDYLKRTPPPSAAIEFEDFRCDFCDQAADIIGRMVMLERDRRYGSAPEVLADLGFDYKISAPLPDDLQLRSPVLVIESGTNKGARLVLGLAEGERRELGRPDFAGNDRSLSRRHLEFSRAGRRYFVRDLDSKNGTLLRGMALEPTGPPVEINHGDRIKVGDIFLRFVFLRDEKKP